MKKILSIFVAILTACACMLCLFGCENSSIEGKYLLEMAGGQANSPVVRITDKDENGNYINVNHGDFVPENFWVEIKGSTMTIHGIISPVSGGGMLKFNVAQEERKIQNFKLETSTDNNAWYAVFDSKGEDTLWQILKDGNEILFLYGKSGGPDLWYSISYKKV